MSNKTPREMAIEILNEKYPASLSKYIEWNDNPDYQLVIRCLEAGARMGWEARNDETQLEDGGKLRTWAYFNEWWASLEGEK